MPSTRSAVWVGREAVKRAAELGHVDDVGEGPSDGPLQIASRALLGVDFVDEADRITRSVTMALDFLEHRVHQLDRQPDRHCPL
jgi:hypothetical protein